MKYTPHDYQKYCIEYIREHPVSALFLDMGLGKTIITLTALNALMFDELKVNKVLVIAPLRVARDTWPAEVKKWDHLQNIEISVIVGSVKERTAAVNHNAFIYIVNRENVKWLVEYYEKNGLRWDFDMIVIDELSSFKNYQSQRFKWLRKVRPFVKRWVGLTGTPTSNGLMDLWAEIGILDGGERLGRFIGRFRESYFKPGSMNPSTGVVFSYTPLAGQDGMEVMSCEVTENKLYLKIVNHRLEMACVGDRVQAGVIISNSEVGLGAVSVQPLVYTLACTNGMVVNSMGERRTHVGRAAKVLEDSFNIYTDETLEAEDHAFMLKLRDTTLAAIEEARFSQIVGVLEQSHGAKITGRVQDVIELTGKAYDLNQPEQDSILNYLIKGGDLSLYGLSNAITRASQDVESYDRATALEGIGWQVATMPKTQWKEINA